MLKFNKNTEKYTYYSIDDILHTYDLIRYKNNKYEIYNYSNNNWEDITFDLNLFKLKKISKFSMSETMYFRELSLRKMLYWSKEFSKSNKINIDDENDFHDKYNYLPIETRILKYLLIGSSKNTVNIEKLESHLFSHDIIMLFMIFDQEELFHKSRYKKDPVAQEHFIKIKETTI